PDTGQAHICQPDPEVGVAGTLLLPSGSGVAQVSLPERSVRSIQISPASGVVNQVARSPDGGRLAVARFSRPETEPIGGSDIVVSGPEGGDPLLIVARERPGDLLGSPTWLAD